jgi:hypothetical protein
MGSGGPLVAVGSVGVSELSETRDVVIRRGGEDEADGRSEGGREASSAEDDVDQCPSGAAVAVGVRVDGLELGVGDCGLDEGRGPDRRCPGVRGDSSGHRRTHREPANRRLLRVYREPVWRLK